MSLAPNAYSSFFDHHDVEAYDEVLEALVPLLRELDDGFIQLLRIHSSATRTKLRALDIGAGTGRASILAADAVQNLDVVASDTSAAMLDGCLSKFAALERKSRRPRLTVVRDDILTPTHAALLVPNSYDIVFTFFTLHHFDHNEKETVYKRAFELLKPGGLFVNGDLYSFTKADLSRHALEFDLHFIRNNLSKRVRRTRSRKKKSALKNLSKTWINHYRTINRCEPMEGKNGQVGMLESCGFVGTCIPIRLWQVGLLAAWKPNSL